MLAVQSRVRIEGVLGALRTGLYQGAVTWIGYTLVRAALKLP